MRNDNEGKVCEGLLDLPEKKRLVGWIEARGRFVENQYPRLLEKSSRDREALALPTEVSPPAQSY
jgi:hypothetical protein